jgi:hypothetical protein
MWYHQNLHHRKIYSRRLYGIKMAFVVIFKQFSCHNLIHQTKPMRAGMDFPQCLQNNDGPG